MDTEFGSKEIAYSWARTGNGLSLAGNWDTLKPVNNMGK